MARKLTPKEIRLLAGPQTQDGAPDFAKVEIVLGDLMKRHDVALKLTAESRIWFGDRFFFPPGQRH